MKTYWIIVDSFALVITMLSLREILLLRRLRGIPDERGQYWFNAIMLFAFALALLCGAIYVDGGRKGFESLLPPYPGSRYAFEQNSIIHDQSWIYTTKEKKELIVNFYRDYAIKNNIQFILDQSEETRISFSLSDGELFLTIRERDGKSVLYFTRDGKKLVVTNK